MQSREATQTTEIGKSGPKFNIHTNDTFEIAKLAVNETINIYVDASLGGGITQSYVLFGGEAHVKSRKMSIKFALWCEPSF
jgi:hypothetical protein